jgi:hypothetical protein
LLNLHFRSRDFDRLIADPEPPTTALRLLVDAD